MGVLHSESLLLKYNVTRLMHANFTINLLHSFCGVDFYNILEGPSNGLERLNFHDEVLQEQRADGSAVLERGDCVIMNNCGFSQRPSR